MKLNIKDLGMIKEADVKFDGLTVIASENRKGEGGLRTKGYFKKSYENKPLISIITVIYNGEKYLEETIQSVINQTYDNVEYIIVDGGSTDGTFDIIKKYEDKIDYWVSERDNGIYDAMNKSINIANGEWLNFMNAGDIFTSQKTILEIFTVPDFKFYPIIYSDTNLLLENGIVEKRFANMNQTIFCHQSVVYKKDMHTKYGYYLVDRNITISDYIFFTQLVNEKSLKVNNEISIFRVGGISSNPKSFYQKISYDFVCGKIGKYYFALVLILYPIYKIIKKVLYVR